MYTGFPFIFSRFTITCISRSNYISQKSTDMKGQLPLSRSSPAMVPSATLPLAVSFAAAFALQNSLALALPTYAPPPPSPVPAIEIIKSYGSLAGPTCYGLSAPMGSSCQLPLSHLKEELGLDGPSSGSGGGSLTREEFADRLNRLPFRWPLKPFGVTEKSLKKTAILNKGAETALYMDQLERRGLYDRRNPTGPLPTSLRPELNAELDGEGIDPRAAEVVYRALVGGGGDNVLTGPRLDEAFHGEGAIDYYGFLKLVGDDNIAWPRQER